MCKHSTVSHQNVTRKMKHVLAGTRNVFDSVLKSRDTVRRVVVTSSIAAVRGTVDPQPPLQGGLYTEEDWNETSSIDSGEGYQRSKATLQSFSGSVSYLAIKWELCFYVGKLCFILHVADSRRVHACRAIWPCMHIAPLQILEP